MLALHRHHRQDEDVTCRPLSACSSCMVPFCSTAITLAAEQVAMYRALDGVLAVLSRGGLWCRGSSAECKERNVELRYD